MPVYFLGKIEEFWKQLNQMGNGRFTGILEK